MTTWESLATESCTASHELFGARRWRNAIARSYFAVYARAAAALKASNVAMPSGREGPSHKKLPHLLLNNLTALPMVDRQKLYSLVGTLYFLRLEADYMPSVCLSEGEARNSMGLMRNAMSLLQRS